MNNRIEQNLKAVKKHIHAYALKYGRDPASIQLLAASKAQPLDRLEAVYQSGQRIFGESYLQEALEKMSRLPKDIEWHFIGHIQSNKTKQIATHFNWVHSVDNEKIAKRLSEQRPANLPPLNICIEYNINHEITKSGVKTQAAAITLAAFCQSLPRLRLRGLMAIPAKQSSLEKQREEFHELTNLWRLLSEKGFSLDTLSMGMSDDLEAAIAEGSTFVRVGTAIFGERF